MLMVLAVGLLIAADDTKKDAQLFEGTWLLVSGKQDGVDTPAKIVKKTKIVITGNKFTFPAASDIGTSQSGTIKIDASKRPKTMDSKATTGPDKGKTSLGIYELSGDRYKVCFAPPGKKRPTNFSSKPGSGHNYQVWKRAP
jgi:uncharacterized protein (TIGR03067 family)